jgi:hypothetical protein
MQSGADNTIEDIIDFTTDPRWFSTHPGEWEVLKINEKYKIYTHAPHPVLNTISGKIVKESKRENGDLYISFGKGYMTKFKVLTQQWPDKCFNRRRYRRNAEYEMVDQLPESAIEIKKWNEWNFENLYYYQDDFFQFMGSSRGYRKLHRCFDKDNRNAHINVIDSSNCPRAISCLAFKTKYLANLHSSSSETSPVSS